MYKFFYNQAASWIGEDKAKDAADAQGNYFVKRGNLRLISLNTNMCCVLRPSVFFPAEADSTLPPADVNNLYTLVRSSAFSHDSSLTSRAIRSSLRTTTRATLW